MWGKLGETENMHLNDDVKYYTSTNLYLKNTKVITEISVTVKYTDNLIIYIRCHCLHFFFFFCINEIRHLYINK